MNLAQITYSYKPITGGADVYAQLLRGVCEDAGHLVHVYQRPRGGFSDPNVHPIESPLTSLLGGRGEFWTLPLGLPGMREELSGYDALIVHYPNYHRFVEWHPATILISHGVFWDDRPGALRSRIKRKLARRAYERASLVVANDTFFLREVGQDVAPGAEPFSEMAPGRFFIPNCVDTAQFSRGEPHPDIPRPAILVPRNLYHNRGVHLAIAAFAGCAGELEGAKLVVVGAEGQPGYLDHCRGLATELGVGQEVVFFGPAPWEQMPAVYSAADLTLIPTLCGEGTSLSALESMACGTATVTTDVAGLADLPTLQAAPTAEALGSALRQAWQDRAEIGRQQEQITRSVYNLDNWKRAWVGLLQRVG